MAAKELKAKLEYEILEKELQLAYKSLESVSMVLLFAVSCDSNI